MRVAAWMFDVRKGEVSANREAALRGLEAAAQVGVELVLLPEMWPTSFLASLGDADPVATLAPHVAASLEVVEEIGAPHDDGGCQHGGRLVEECEEVAQFGAEVKLLNQAVINYLDLCDTPEKCEESARASTAAPA